jgi:predicted transcriptional regulator
MNALESNERNLQDIITRHKEDEQQNVLGLVSEVVAAYVSNNRLESGEVSELIYQVYTTLLKLQQIANKGQQRPAGPAVSIEDSITNDYIVCLEDGKKLKMLKRHLRAVYNMTPEEYRERWGLPMSYPMVAPNYAKKRSTLAKLNGLGRTRKKGKRQTV